LPLGADALVASRLGQGRSFAASLADLPASSGQRAKLDEAGRTLDALAAETDARRFIRYLRTAGGLDAYFTEHEHTFQSTEHVEVEILEQSEREASGSTVAEYRAVLQARSERLRAVRDDINGLELTTIHRAKGREWPDVHVFGCDEGQLPHQRSLEVEPEQRAAGEGIEAERRLAYVAVTRARGQLVLYVSGGVASRFLAESGLRDDHPGSREPASGRPSARPPVRHTDIRSRSTSGSAARPVTVGGVAGPVIATAQQVGLAYALRTAPSRQAALEAAAIALERRLVGAPTTSEQMTVAGLLDAIETLDDRDRQAARHSAVILDPTIPLVRLTRSPRHGLARALRRLATRPP
jgi:hypothetical protein